MSLPEPYIQVGSAGVHQEFQILDFSDLDDMNTMKESVNIFMSHGLKTITITVLNVTLVCNAAEQSG